MNVRAKRGKSTTWQRRSRRTGHAGVGAEPSPAQQIAPELTDPSRARSRQAGPSQDTAVYNCECGYVFEEHVSTTVGCPHCGQAQAW
ncbi:MAG: hypothetical protein ACXVUE_04435 [Solirubrobacteraceae bacterium]